MATNKSAPSLDGSPTAGQVTNAQDYDTTNEGQNQGRQARSILDIATKYVEEGLSVVPIPFRSKAPIIADWPKLGLSLEQLPEYFDGHPQNIGVSLGEPSGGLVDVDLDCEMAVRIAPLLLPETRTFGRSGKPKSHWLYRCDPVPKSRKFTDVAKKEAARDRGTLLEVRSTGCQTVFPGSTHVSGESIEFDNDEGIEPLAVAHDELMHLVSLGAAATLLARHWPPKGSRQEAALALAGGLSHSGWEEGSVREFVAAVGLGAGDEEWRKRAETGASTLQAAENGRNTTGWPTLSKLVGDDVVERVLEWLTLKSDGNSETEEDSKNHHAIVVSLADVKPAELRWLWPSRIPLGKLTTIAGDPGIGKSFITMDIAARVSKGTHWPDRPDEPIEAGSVILLTAEDGLDDTVRPRLDALGADVSKIRAMKAVRRPDKKGELFFCLDKDLPALEKLIAEVRPRLVIVDPISAYLGKLNANSNSEVRGVLGPLSDLAQKYECAILAVTHLNKNEAATKALYRAMESLAFVAAARAAWFVSKDPTDEGRSLVLPLKMNLGPKPPGISYRIVGDPLGIEWDPTPIHEDPNKLLNGNAGGADKLDTAMMFLKSLLVHGPLPANEVKQLSKELGIADRTLERAKDGLGVKPKKVGFGSDGTWTWELPS